MYRVCSWGLVPSYTKPDVKPDHFRMFNARSDDMKPVFTRLLKHRRCVVLLNGFYEWKKVRFRANACTARPVRSLLRQGLDTPSVRPHRFSWYSGHLTPLVLATQH